MLVFLGFWTWFTPVLTGIICLVVGFIVGVVVTRKMVQKQLQENPPISENQIRVMLKATGQPASEKRIRQIMNQVNNAK